MSWLSTNREDVGKLILRVAVAGCVLVYGYEKLADPGMVAYIGTLFAGIGLPTFFAYGVYLGEVIAPLLVFIGWRAKLFAGIMAGTMVVVILLGHPSEIWPLSEFQWSGIELQALFLFNSLAVLLLGAGKFAFSDQSVWD